MSDNATALLLAGELIDGGQHQKAIEQLNQMGEDGFDNVLSWLFRATAYYELDEQVQAIKACDAGLELSPDFNPLLILRARIFLENRDLEQSERYILKALKNNPENVEALNIYAVMLIRGGQFEKAGKVLNRALQYEPESEMSIFSQSLLAYVTSNDRAAMSHIDRLLEKSPMSEMAIHLRGQYLLSQRRIDSGLKHIDQSARLDPSNEMLVAAAREALVNRHWSLWPLRQLNRLDPAVLWFVALGIIFGSRYLGFEDFSLWFSGIYLLLVIYSWTYAPLFRWWKRRRYK